MQITVISNYDEFLGLEDAWKNVFERCDTDNIFISWEWCSLWWKHFGRNQRLMILVIKDRAETVGIAPLMSAGGNFFSLGKPVISFMGGELADYIDFLVLRNNKEVIMTIMDFLLKFAGWGLVDLRRIPEYSPNLIAVEECLSGLGCDYVVRKSSTSPAVKITGRWDDYYKSLSKGLRQDIRTTLNKLKLIGDVKFVNYNAYTFKEALDTLFELHGKRQDYKLGQSLFDIQSNRDFFHELALAFIKPGWIDISALKIKDRVISIAFAFRHKEIFYYWVPAFDTEFIKYSLSKVHIQNLLKSCFEQNYTEFDFMRGDEEYKFKWTNAIHKSYEVKIYKNMLCCKLDSLRFTARKYIKNLYNNYPLFKKILVKISKNNFS